MKNNTQKTPLTLHRPQKRLGVGGMIFFIIIMDMCVPLSTDMYLPAMPTMTGHLTMATDALVKSTVTVFFLFYALGMVVWGPLSDKYGRKKPLFIGLVIYSAATLLCGIALNIYVLLLGRILQGLGAASVTAISYAMINDCFVGKTKETVLAIAQTLSGFGPVLAPVIGSWILLFTSWRGVFFVLLSFGVIGIILTLLYEESIYTEERFHGSVFSTFGQLGVVLKNKAFTSIVAIYAILLLPLYAYLNLSSYIYVNQFGCSEQVYSYYHAAAALLSMAGPAIYIKFFSEVNKNSFTVICFGGCVIASALMIFVGSVSPVVFCGLIFVYYMLTNLLRPYSVNLILEQNKNDVGSASSVMNMANNVLAVLGMGLATLSFNNMVSALGVIFFVATALPLIGWIALMYSKIPIRGFYDKPLRKNS